MLFWSDFRVRSQKMMEDMKENQDMLLVTPRLSSADIIGNHVPELYPDRDGLDARDRRQMRLRRSQEDAHVPQ
jgi:hypothetical protein